MAAAWEELQGEIVVLAVGPTELVFLGKGSGKGNTTGAPFGIQTPVRVAFTRRRVVHFEWFATKKEALEAAGLRE